MPVVKISVLDHWSSGKIKELNQAVHNGLVSALGIADWDFFHRVYKFSKDDFVFPDFKSDNFMIIELYIFPGRTDEQKAAVYRDICHNVEKLGIKAEDVLIQIIEQPDINWGFGGKPRNSQ
ncbi:MAG: tautomerase family protein [Spirochaetaceae bacterium]|nr:tautomerase family protein [Spirochaetaceae bacterium]